MAIELVTICNCQQLPNLAGQYPYALRRIRLPLYTKVYNLWAGPTGVFLMKILQNFIWNVYFYLIEEWLLFGVLRIRPPCSHVDRQTEPWDDWKFRFERQEFRDSLLIKLSEFSNIQLRILKEEGTIYSWWKIGTVTVYVCRIDAKQDCALGVQRFLTWLPDRR